MVVQQWKTKVRSETSNAPEIRLTNVGKRYGATTVLHDISLTLTPGEIHSILGENGAGKSTMLKIIGGAIVADEGAVSLNGRPVRISTPRDSMVHGISLISQELALIPDRTVLENVFLGRWTNAGGFVRPQPDLDHFNQLVAETGFELDPHVLVGSLPIGLRQQVEILKALARGAKVLCMDEPTAVLNEAEKQKLLTVVRRLSKAGTTIVLVSHYLEEVLEISDRITILRDGKHIVTEPVGRHSPDSLVKLMVGRDIDVLIPEIAPVNTDAPIAIEVSGLTTNRVQDITLSVRRGEILGIAGLVGSGRSEALMGIFGADKRTSGTVEVAGVTVPPNSIRGAMKSGLALIPESRKDQGLVMNRGVTENIALATLGRRSVLGFVNTSKEHRASSRIGDEVDLRGARKGTLMADLSGGNQQKALFAKWLMNPPKVLLVDEPTRGVDVPAKARIHRMIVKLAAKGTAVVLVSSELEEVIGLSHRIHVMRHGRIVAEFDRTATRDEVMSSAFLK